MNDLINSRILVTGGAGLVGSTIIDQLLTEGIKEIIVIDNFFRGRDENLKEALASGKIKVVKGDIRDAALLGQHFKGIDYCFHMAALRITHCASEPREALGVMYDGSFNVFEACSVHKLKKLVFASSASIYGQADVFPTDEKHHPYNNRTLYGAAKTANELMLRSFSQMTGLKYNALRFFNIYGPRMDTHGKYTEVLIRWYHLIKKGEQPLIFGDGQQTMDFIYIDDVARSNILALKTETDDEVYNVASGIETSLEELCFALLDAMNSKLKPKYMPLPKDREKVEVERRLADVRKAQEELGFSAQVDLKEGLKQLIQWLDQQDFKE